MLVDPKNYTQNKYNFIEHLSLYLSLEINNICEYQLVL